MLAWLATTDIYNYIHEVVDMSGTRVVGSYNEPHLVTARLRLSLCEGQKIGIRSADSGDKMAARTRALATT